ncbi:hypothetical protein B0H67DRAFT_573537 [Lasiosphaeris hirsuta]|uniref:Uncharacterized protein n=1 Tax=Lasiosphaeris hirsuta TaxID=260670 RepID=A0AA40APG7_9PEZI|nr:hypothetical protein B0H67DRAFT_573537 [Lasiosphaeris hirsuta]
MAPTAARIFSSQAYLKFFVKDPAGRRRGKAAHSMSYLTHPEKERPPIMDMKVRLVPGLRWLQMVVSREIQVRDIIATMARMGHRLPPGTHITLKKLWVIMDTASSAMRAKIMENRSFIDNKDLYNAQVFIVKLLMLFNDPIFGPQSPLLMNLFLGQRTGFTPLWALLRRKKYQTSDEVLELKIRYDVGPTAEKVASGGLVLGVPIEEMGIEHFEGWGRGRDHLMRVDELVPLEACRRQLDLDTIAFDMMMHGHVDAKMGTSLVPTLDEMYMSDDEFPPWSEQEPMRNLKIHSSCGNVPFERNMWLPKHARKARWSTLPKEEVKMLLDEEWKEINKDWNFEKTSNEYLAAIDKLGTLLDSLSIKTDSNSAEPVTVEAFLANLGKPPEEDDVDDIDDFDDFDVDMRPYSNKSPPPLAQHSSNTGYWQSHPQPQYYDHGGRDLLPSHHPNDGPQKQAHQRQNVFTNLDPQGSGFGKQPPPLSSIPQRGVSYRAIPQHPHPNTYPGSSRSVSLRPPPGILGPHQAGPSIWPPPGISDPHQTDRLIRPPPAISGPHRAPPPIWPPPGIPNPYQAAPRQPLPDSHPTSYGQGFQQPSSFGYHAPTPYSQQLRPRFQSDYHALAFQRAQGSHINPHLGPAGPAFQRAPPASIMPYGAASWQSHHINPHPYGQNFQGQRLDNTNSHGVAFQSQRPNTHLSRPGTEFQQPPRLNDALLSGQNPHGGNVFGSSTYHNQHLQQQTHHQNPQQPPPPRLSPASRSLAVASRQYVQQETAQAMGLPIPVFRQPTVQHPVVRGQQLLPSPNIIPNLTRDGTPGSSSSSSIEAQSRYHTHVNHGPIEDQAAENQVVGSQLGTQSELHGLGYQQPGDHGFNEHQPMDLDDASLRDSVSVDHHITYSDEDDTGADSELSDGDEEHEHEHGHGHGHEEAEEGDGEDNQIPGHSGLDGGNRGYGNEDEEDKPAEHGLGDMPLGEDGSSDGRRSLDTKCDLYQTNCRPPPFDNIDDYLLSQADEDYGGEEMGYDWDRWLAEHPPPDDGRPMPEKRKGEGETEAGEDNSGEGVVGNEEEEGNDELVTMLRNYYKRW